jgi:hypothetical protein
MRTRNYRTVLVYGTGIPFSLVPMDFNGEIGRVTWVNNEDEDDPWIKVTVKGTEYRVHSIQVVAVLDELAKRLIL